MLMRTPVKSAAQTISEDTQASHCFGESECFSVPQATMYMDHYIHTDTSVFDTEYDDTLHIETISYCNHFKQVSTHDKEKNMQAKNSKRKRARYYRKARTIQADA